MIVWLIISNIMMNYNPKYCSNNATSLCIKQFNLQSKAITSNIVNQTII